MAEYLQNEEITYEKNQYYEKNTFKSQIPISSKIPKYEEVKHLLPQPIFDGHDDYLECYDYAWKTAFSNLKNPVKDSGFISAFIDTAFNGSLFMWDSAFILMFAKYANKIFPFQKTLDNFYALQHKDGFICREINETTGKDRFTRLDPSSTGPNLMPWSEWLYYQNFGDLERLKKVYYPLRAYHIWFRKNRTWRDGTYFATGWSCGMDNIPRLSPGYHVEFSNGKMVWIDTCLQAILSCQILIKMNNALGNIDDVSDLIKEEKDLKKFINKKLWDKKSKFYYDLWENGKLNYVKHLGSYWSLITKTANKSRLKALVSHLLNEKEFNRPVPVPTLSADNKDYNEEGGYWRGGVWAPTNYMLLKGLSENGFDELSYSIADKYLKAVVEVYNKDKTLWENYAPEYSSKGTLAKPNFVGWTGLVPISIFFEYVIGIKADFDNNKIVWNINKLERHGIKNYPFGNDNVLDLVCEERKDVTDEPQISIKSTKPVEVEIIWGNNKKIVKS